MSNDRIEAARPLMTQLAVDLQRILPPTEVVRLLVGAAIGVLLDGGTRAAAADYFRAIADEIDRDDSGPAN